MSRGLLAALVAVATAATMAVPVAQPATQGRSFVVYAKPTRAQFIGHADDRERGDLANPFQVDEVKTPPSANAGKKGARAGDNALFSFKLFSDAGLRRPIGTAIYHCTFNFAHEALCEADFALANGSMIAAGPADLDTGAMILPVIGGTGRYAGAHGQLTSTASGVKNTQIIRFQLV
jgi:hypothetical protein